MPTNVLSRQAARLHTAANWYARCVPVYFAHFYQERHISVALCLEQIPP